jgi:hypothetical protein
MAASCHLDQTGRDNDLQENVLKRTVPAIPDISELPADIVDAADVETGDDVTRLCALNPRDGYWQYYYPSSPHIRKVIYEQVCVDQILCPAGGTCYYPDPGDLVRINMAGGYLLPPMKLTIYNSEWSYTSIWQAGNNGSVYWFYYYSAQNVLMVVTQIYYSGEMTWELRDYFVKYYQPGDVDVIW